MNRLPPIEDCQRNMLAGVLYGEAYGHSVLHLVLQRVDAGMFPDADAQQLFRVLEQRHRERESNHPEDVLANVRGSVRDYATSCVSALAESQTGSEHWALVYANDLRKHHVRAERHSVMRQAERALQDGDDRRAVTLLEDVPPEAGTDAIEDMTPAAIEAQAERAPARKVTWPFGRLNSVAREPEAGELVVVAARPSVGKTTFAVQWATHLLRKRERVLLVTLEMTPARILSKFAACVSGAPERPDERDASTEADWTEALGYLRTLNLWIPPKPPRDAGVFFPWLTEQVRRVGATVVVLDYLQLLRGEGRNTYERATDVSMRCQEFAAQGDVVLMALAQLSRASSKERNREPRLDDLRDSGQLEQDAAYVAMLHTPDDALEGDSDTGQRRLLIRKARGGKLMAMDVELQGACSRVVPLV